MAHRPKLTDQQRDQRRAEDRERLQAAARALLDSDGWARWVRVRATNGLARFSMRNVLLLALQTEGSASYVAGFKRWLALGYCVRRGEKALRICAKRALLRLLRGSTSASSALPDSGRGSCRSLRGVRRPGLASLHQKGHLPV